MKHELKQSKPHVDGIEFPCLVVHQPPFQLYAFVISAKALWNYVEINRRDMENDQGYQRALSASRVKSIVSYIESNNPIPNSILVSFDDPEVRVSEAEDGIRLYLPNKANLGWVIDGQHRLAGAKEAKNDIELVTIAFLEMDITGQIQQFVTINREAKGVPTSLYLDLLAQLPPPVSPSEQGRLRASDIADFLRENEDSPFNNRIVIGSPKRGQLSMTNIVRKVAPLVYPDKGKFHLYTYLEQARIILNYFKALETVFPAEFYESRGTFYKTLGFGAAMNLLPTVFDLSTKDFSGFTVADVAKILRRIDYFDFRIWDTMGAGSAAEIQAGADLRDELLKMSTTDSPEGSLRL